MRRLFLHVEEPSMHAALEALLPGLMARHPPTWRIIEHRNLLAELPARLRGYARQADPALRVLVLLDRDARDCRLLKARLEDAARAAGLATKTSPGWDGRFQVVNRIVVEELEAWFLGDVPALRAAFPGVPATLAARRGLRDPDAIQGGTWETLLRVLQQAGHYPGTTRLPKIEVARRVAATMQPDANRSASFQAFRAGLDALLT